VGWSYGFVRVYLENFRDVRHGSRGGFFFKYQYLVYMGLFALVLHPLRILSLILIALSTANGLDLLLGLNWIPDGPATDPAYFLLAYVKYAGFALLASSSGASDLREWAAWRCDHFLYGLQILPATLGYSNWPPPPLGLQDLPRPLSGRESAGTAEGGKAVTPELYWEERARRFSSRGAGLKAVCAYGMPGFYNRAIDLSQRLALARWLRVPPGT
jgi:hypothetical protein